MNQKGRVLPLSELTSITPLDGRYRKRLEHLAEFSSEYGLIKTRIEIEAKYLSALSENKILRPLSKKEKKLLETLINNFSVKDAEKVKEIEIETRHDVKAVEMLLRDLLKRTTLKDVIEMIHFGLTSEDINNISYRLILQRITKNVLVPQLLNIVEKLSQISSKNKSLAMIARTHGQAAVPTTLGKEISVFVNRLSTQIQKLKNYKLTGKLNGAVGNYNALFLAYPNTNWIKFSEKFVGYLGLVPNLITTQVNPYDDIAEFFQIIQRINNILIDLDQDIWRYISDGWFIQIAREREVGSSTMPQKVNPIDFENSEGNLGLANSILEFMARKLMVSRLQRDLSDLTVIRNIGTVLGYSLLGYKSLLTGLSRIKPKEDKILQDLDKDWSVLTEAVQTILRKEGISDSYSLVKEKSRGKKFGEKDWKEWTGKLKVSQSIKKDLEKLTPKKYIGLAKTLTEKAIKEINK